MYEAVQEHNHEVEQLEVELFNFILPFVKEHMY